MADIVFPGQVPGGTIGFEYMPSNYDLVIYRGDYVPITITLKDSSGTVMNLNGFTPKASIRSDYSSTTTYAFATAQDNANGKVTLTLTSPVSSTIPAGPYIWDFQLTDTNGNTRTYIAGDVTVYDEVTK